MPADIARELGANVVIAVDIAAESDSNFTDYGDSLSGHNLCRP